MGLRQKCESRITWSKMISTFMKKRILTGIGSILLVHRLTVGDVTAAENDATNGAPVFTDSRIRRASERVQKHEWAEAVSILSEVLHTHTNDVSAYELRARAYLATGNLDKAVTDLTEVIGLDSKNASAYLNRGNIYRLWGELDKAKSDFNVCLRLNPTNDYAYKLRAATYNAQGEFDKGILDCNTGLRLNPNDADGLTERALAYFHKAKFNEAISDLNAAIQLQPTNSKPYNDLGWLRATCPVGALRDGKQAVELSTRACELSNWKDWRCVDSLAAAFAERGDFKRAAQYENQAMGMAGVSDEEKREMQLRYSLFNQKRPFREAVKP
jgi:tetratricopeptide (TPR) repeat protein